jgi:hypothetical protein
MPTRIARTPERLLETLDEIVNALDAFDLDERRAYTRRLASRLARHVLALRTSFATGADRKRLADLLAPITELIHEISGAATKGEIPIFGDEYDDAGDHALNRYWDLYTIFREIDRR